MAGRRRGRGEGSIYRRKDGRYVGQYEVNGKRRSFYGKSRKEVVAKLNKAIADRDARLVFDAEGLTLCSSRESGDDVFGGGFAGCWVRVCSKINLCLRRS